MLVDPIAITEVVSREREEVYGGMDAIDTILAMFIDGDLSITTYCLLADFIDSDPDLQAREAVMRRITGLLLTAYADDDAVAAETTPKAAADQVA